MISRKFVCKEDEDWGSIGWVPALIPHFNAGNGMTVAHDTLEHFDPKDDSLEAEFMAFGAMLYWRGEGDYWGKLGRFDPRVGHQISGEVVEFIRNRMNGGGDFRDPGRTYKLDEELEDMLSDIVTETERELQYSDLEKDEKRRIRDWRKIGLKWMRKGYRKAHKRWGIDSPYRRTDLFLRLEKAVDRYSREEGMEMTVRVNPKTLEVKVSVDWPDCY